MRLLIHQDRVPVVAQTFSFGRFDLVTNAALRKPPRATPNGINWTAQFTGLRSGRWFAPLRRKKTLAVGGDENVGGSSGQKVPPVVSLRHGFLYLVAVMDWYSRYVLS